MTIPISQALNEARLSATGAWLDLGTDNAVIQIYNGVQPAIPGAAVTSQVKLVEVKLDKPCGVIVNGTLVLSSADLPLVQNSGTATWARVLNGAGAWAFDCDVTNTSGSGIVKLPDTSLFAGGKTQMTSGVLT